MGNRTSFSKTIFTGFTPFTFFTRFACVTLFILTAFVPSCVTHAQAPPAPGVTAPRFVVVLDAAHGGDDAGAKLGKQTEKELALVFSMKLRSLLVARGMAVVTTRESDAAVDQDRRAEIANRADAAACVNLHAALASPNNGSAVHLFVSSLPQAGDVHFVPWRTAQSAWITRSTALAGTLNSALTQAGVTVTLGRTALPAVDSMACPAVALEISPERPADAENASGADSAAFEDKVAEALAAALVAWRSEAARFGERQP